MDYLEYLASPNPYIEGFKTGDRVRFRDGYRTNWEAELTTGTIAHIGDHSIEVIWDGYPHPHNYTKFHIANSEWWEKVLEKDHHKPKFKILEKSKGDDFPELLVVPKTQGYLEEYVVINKQKKVYWYTRYVCQESSGKLKHYHVPKKQKESIETLWRSGATAKELCTALGKTYLGKSSK